MERTRPVHPGSVIALIGVTAVVLGCFLPAAEPQGFVLVVRNNTLIQSGHGAYLLLAAVLTAGLVYRRHAGMSSAFLPVVLVGVFVVAAAAFLGDRMEVETLTGRSVPADAGIGISAVALGGIAIAAGGLILRRPDGPARTPA